MKATQKFSTPMDAGKQLSYHEGSILGYPEEYKVSVSALQYLKITKLDKHIKGF